MAEEKFPEVRTKRKPNWWIVLNALEKGATLVLPEGHVLIMQDDQIGFKGTRVELGKEMKEEEVFLPFSIETNDFLSMCSKLPEEKILDLVFQAGLIER